MPAGIDRLTGYRDAIAEAGLPADPHLEASGDFTQAGGAEAMTRLLAARPDIDAVFAASDLMAAGALSVLAAAGRRVPRGCRDRRLRRLAGRHLDQPAADQRPSTHRGDGPRGRPPARRSGRRHGPGHAARDPGHRPGEARLERREAFALSRPATGGISPPWVDAPIQCDLDDEVEIDQISQRRSRTTMNARRSVPQGLDRPGRGRRARRVRLRQLGDARRVAERRPPARRRRQPR